MTMNGVVLAEVKVSWHEQDYTLKQISDNSF